ncbi:MAG: hypothetical protein HZA02_10935, partial [Nitrospinae bacterium]|nr:hypothetical protein [Nitrospinota bacterium]
MTTLKKSPDIALTLALLVLMTMTRGHLLKPVASFPNATLAIFFIAGIYLREYFYPALLFLAAGLIDYVAIQNGASGWCVTPAYIALVPAYLAPWFGGRQFTSLEIGSVRAALSMAGVLLAGSTVSFLISNG